MLKQTTEMDPLRLGNFVIVTVRRNTFFCLTFRKKNSSETSAVPWRRKIWFLPLQN